MCRVSCVCRVCVCVCMCVYVCVCVCVCVCETQLWGREAASFTIFTIRTETFALGVKMKRN